jgi:hypothetical protein
MATDDELFDDLVERDLFVELVADGCNEISAGFEVGWTPARTARNLADPAFREIVETAKLRADGSIERALFKLAKGGNLGAMQMWLYNRQPERWKDVKRIEVKQDTTFLVSLVESTKRAVMEMLGEHGPGALQPSFAGAIEAKALDIDLSEQPESDD